ncbi:AlkA N-terminal domain-containing protein, partial [Chromobacterium subtsugae]
LLRYRPPYHWPAMLLHLAAHAIPGVETVQDDGYARTIAWNGARGELAVRPGAGHALSVTIRFPQLAALPAILARVRAMFDLAADPAMIERHLSQDPRLAGLIAARPGLRLPGRWDAPDAAADSAQAEPDAYPAVRQRLLEDLGLSAAERERLHRRAEAWQPWRAYAIQHLWTERHA